MAAFPALVAFVAFAAEGTWPSDDSSTSAPITWPSAIFALETAFLPSFVPSTAPFWIFFALTAPFFSCAVPTLFLGSLTAA